MRVVTAVRDLNVKKGSTGSRAMACDDGRNYFVKFKDGTRTVVNEYVGYSLADHLDVPVPESRLVIVPRELIETSDDMRSRGVEAGVHHGSLWLEDCIELGAREAMGVTITNSSSLPGVVVFDNLVLNRDRNNARNNLLRRTASGGFEYNTVDFNEIMAGPRWTVETMNLVRGSAEIMPVLPVIGRCVRSLSSFSPWLERAEGIREEAIRQMLSGIPGSWNITESEKDAISDFILTRTSLVRGILLANRSRFPNWNDESDSSPRAND